MNAYKFYKSHPKEKVEAVATKAGTTFDYFKQIAYGNRRPSVALAERLVAASDRELDFVSLLTSVKAPVAS